jgi:hypothetical protein
LKSFLSGLFRHAKAEGYLDERNPMRDVTIPRTVRRVKFLRSMLENYRQYLEGPVEEDNLGKTLNPTTRMFAGERRGPSMNLPNLVKRTIVPNLTRCSVCRFPKHQHTVN